MIIKEVDVSMQDSATVKLASTTTIRAERGVTSACFTSSVVIRRTSNCACETNSGS